MFTSFQSFEKYYLLAGWNILAQILSVFCGGEGVWKESKNLLLNSALGIGSKEESIGLNEMDGTSFGLTPLRTHT